MVCDDDGIDAVAGDGAVASSEFKEESSGLAILNPPRDCDKLRSPSIVRFSAAVGFNNTRTKDSSRNSN